jgi:hypothetical protein
VHGAAAAGTDPRLPRSTVWIAPPAAPAVAAHIRLSLGVTECRRTRQWRDSKPVCARVERRQLHQELPSGGTPRGCHRAKSTATSLSLLGEEPGDRTRDLRNSAVVEHRRAGRRNDLPDVTARSLRSAFYRSGESAPSIASRR